MSRLLFCIFVFFTVFSFTFVVIPVYAVEEVIINEIAWMGTPVAGIEEKQWWRYEWLELYNAGDTVGMLDGWTVELSREKIDFKIPLSGTITSQGYFLIGASDKIPNLDLNYKNLGGKFFNGGQKIVLKNNLGEIVEEVDARSGWPAGDNKTKQTMERKGVSDTSYAGWQTSKEPGGTPKALNSEGIVNEDQPKPGLGFNPKPGLGKDEIEKDLSQSFQSRVPIVNPITLLAGLLALGFSGVLLLAKRSLALRQRSGQASRQERRQS